MTRKRVLIILLVFFSSVGAFAYAADPARKDESFGLFLKDFQKALVTDDKEKMASMINFPNFTWEENQDLRQVKTKEDFLKNYDRMFTPAIKKKIAAAGKPTLVDENTYFLNWYVKDTEYSLDFARKPGGSFKFLGLSLGSR
ncbi:MAG: hypothetical protein AB9873_07780 [Syntrophobacteraceae bacterium]